MRICGLLALALPLYVAAQQPAPTINPDGIVRADSTRPGLLSPGIVFSVWGHGYGPKAGCKGPATEVCGVQVLLDGVPIEVQYTSDILINARMPDAPGQAVSRLVVVSGGRRSDPVEVGRLPETAVISLDGVARVDGPVWIHVALPPGGGISYPPLRSAWDFACDAFEVRKDGKLLAPLPHPEPGMTVYSGPSCPGYASQGTGPKRTNRLPLHLQYSFSEPGIYEVRLSHYGNFGRRPEDIRVQSAWTPIQVLPAAARTLGPLPQEPDELVTDFLPNLLALRDDETLSVLAEYLYHPSQRVRAYVASALGYWPDAVIEPFLMEALRANGPSDVVVDGLRSNATEVAELALPYLFSSDPVLFQGAIRAAGMALDPHSALDPALRSRVVERLIAAATGNLGHADAQMTTDLIADLGPIREERVHNLLWNLVSRHTGTEQALICIAWQKDPKDLPRLTDYMIAAAGDDQSGRELYGVPYAMRNQFGAAALPWLRTALEKAQSPVLRLRCAEELMRGNDPAGFAFAADAIDHDRAWKTQIRTMVSDQFPDMRNASDAQMAAFLGARLQ